jgi:hypothetical protein
VKSDTYVKLLIGAALFATWVALVVCKVPGTEDIVNTIKLSLAGLGVYHLGTRPAATAAAHKEGGFARPKLLVALGSLALAVSACQSVTGPNATTQSAQVVYTQACSAYGAAFGVALQMRMAGKLNRAQIDQVTLLDSQVTPVCTGPLPADPAAATQQITAAVTTLTILEATHQGQ